MISASVAAGGEAGPMISASVAAADQAALGEAVAALSPHVDFIHIDVEDGVFSPHITLGPAAIRDLRPHSALPFEAHLMVQHPEDHIPAIARAGADVIIVNVEACPYPLRTLRLIRSLGKEAGLAFNYGTPLANLAYLRDELDLVLLMTSEPDLEGQEYIPASPARVREAVRSLAGARVRVIVDGGISDGNIGQLWKAGAREFVVGRYLWRGGDVATQVRNLRAALRSTGHRSQVGMKKTEA